MIARRVDKVLPGTAGPSVAQLLAEELLTEMMRKYIDVIGLLELERDVYESVGGIADHMGAGEQTVPAAALAATLIDRKSTRLNSSHIQKSRMPSSA